MQFSFFPSGIKTETGGGSAYLQLPLYSSMRCLDSLLFEIVLLKIFGRTKVCRFDRDRSHDGGGGAVADKFFPARRAIFSSRRSLPICGDKNARLPGTVSLSVTTESNDGR